MRPDAVLQLSDLTVALRVSGERYVPAQAAGPNTRTSPQGHCRRASENQYSHNLTRRHFCQGRIQAVVPSRARGELHSAAQRAQSGRDLANRRKKLRSFHAGRMSRLAICRTNAANARLKSSTVWRLMQGPLARQGGRAGA
jgi:hypothetical protein